METDNVMRFLKEMNEGYGGVDEFPSTDQSSILNDDPTWDPDAAHIKSPNYRFGLAQPNMINSDTCVGAPSQNNAKR